MLLHLYVFITTAISHSYESFFDRNVVSPRFLLKAEAECCCYFRQLRFICSGKFYFTKKKSRSFEADVCGKHASSSLFVATKAVQSMLSSALIFALPLC